MPKRYRLQYSVFFIVCSTVNEEWVLWKTDTHFKVLLPTDVQNNCFKKILKFTLKQLQHVSALSPSSGSVQFELAKVTSVQTVH